MQDLNGPVAWVPQRSKSKVASRIFFTRYKMQDWVWGREALLKVTDLNGPVTRIPQRSKIKWLLGYFFHVQNAKGGAEGSAKSHRPIGQTCTAPLRPFFGTPLRSPAEKRGRFGVSRAAAWTDGCPPQLAGQSAPGLPGRLLSPANL